MVPTVTGPLRLKGRVHSAEARLCRAHTTRKLKFTLPGPMTIVDTVSNGHYRDRVSMAMAFADLLNEEARALEAEGVDVIQFDEPAFNVYMDEVRDWGVEALHRAAAGLNCTTAVHICYGYGIKANLEWKESLGGTWTQYERIFPAIAAGRIDQVSVEARNSRVPLELLGLLAGKDVLLGVIDVAHDEIEKPEEIVGLVRRAMAYVPAERLTLSTNCGMAPMRWDVAVAKLNALGAGARLARQELAG
jgi:5-methyltetrahydropteroyltriglutamate--homocysteine methyltransferase